MYCNWHPKIIKSVFQGLEKATDYIDVDWRTASSVISVLQWLKKKLSREEWDDQKQEPNWDELSTLKTTSSICGSESWILI